MMSAEKRRRAPSDGAKPLSEPRHARKSLPAARPSATLAVRNVNDENDPCIGNQQVCLVSVVALDSSQRAGAIMCPVGGAIDVRSQHNLTTACDVCSVASLSGQGTVPQPLLQKDGDSASAKKRKQRRHSTFFGGTYEKSAAVARGNFDDYSGLRGRGGLGAPHDENDTTPEDQSPLFTRRAAPDYAGAANALLDHVVRWKGGVRMRVCAVVFVSDAPPRLMRRTAGALAVLTSPRMLPRVSLSSAAGAPRSGGSGR